ncbi:magnesium and cobalt transport protein CorA [Rothia sp. P7208]|uniref:magnesium and cobalt transport protein CorA n=1 Tax=Rothia sp. P7208 TaxID=3402660 RepID=UPI003AC7689F
MPILVNTINLPDGSSTSSDSLENTHSLLREQPESVAFIGMRDPSVEEMRSLVEKFGMNELAVEDSMEGHQRAKIDRYGDSYFLVLRPAVYRDREEEIRLGEIHLFMGPNFLVSIIKDYLREEQDIRQLFAQIAGQMGGQDSSWDMMHLILDAVVDGYTPVIDGLENDGDEIEDSLFSREDVDSSKISQRIYELLNEVADFKRACKPMTTILDLLMGRLRMLRYRDDSEEQLEILRRFRDVHDHAILVNERLDDLRSSLQNALEVNSTLVAERQNDDMKRISAWAAILVAPTIIGAIYGMNFDNMPELHWKYGYPFSLALMFGISMFLWGLFKRKDWL